MSHVPDAAPTPTPSTSSDPSVGQLMTQLAEQTSRLVRDERQLAQVELKKTAKHAGVGAGLFGASGVLAWFGLAALMATAIIALALVLPAWLAALIVTVILFVAAAIVALVGKKQVEKAPEPAEHVVDSVKSDVQAVKEIGHDTNAKS